MRHNSPPGTASPAQSGSSGRASVALRTITREVSFIPITELSVPRTYSDVGVSDAPAAESRNSAVPSRLRSSASLNGPTHTTAASDRSTASNSTTSCPRKLRRTCRPPGRILRGITRCRPAGARKNCRATRGPQNRVLPYQRYSPSAGGIDITTVEPDGARE